LAAPVVAGKRARTRQRLLDAARVIFERDGFHDARLADIVQEARVATGTFYNYYPSKEEIFRDLMDTVIADLIEVSSEQDGPARDDPVGRIYASNRAYVRGYRRHARLMTLLLQLGEIGDTAQLNIRATFERRLSRAIRRWQETGLAYADLDAVYIANALAYMVDRFLYEWTVLDLEYDEEQVVETLSKLWVRALGLDHPPLTTAANQAARAFSAAVCAPGAHTAAEKGGG
jgi:AcrR family transcriptional regulator